MTFDDDANELVTARLLNWGLWSRGKVTDLDYPKWYEIFSRYLPTANHLSPDGIDAAHIEYVLSSLNLGALKGIGLGDLYQLVCKLEYVEHERPRELKAEYVRKRFKLPCSERTFRFHLYNAKKAVYMLANPL